MKAEFVTYGEPVSKQRPRFGRGCTYTPKKTLDAEKKIALDYKIQNPKKYWDKGIPIRIEIKFFHKIAVSDSKKKKEQKISGEIRPIIKKDTDNCIKTVMDALNKVAYEDDSQIVRIVSERWYSEVPRTEVIISDL